MDSFECLRVQSIDEKIEARVERLTLDGLDPGEVVIRTAWSSINYKDALAGTGKGRIMRRLPMVGGIDASGRVEVSTDPRFSPGDGVLVTGYGMSQDHDGGYSELMRVPAEWVVPLPATLDLRDAMAMGTAGFTAALAYLRMEQNGQTPSLGPILVTGATGGVGSLAVNIFASRGFDVTALTGKSEEAYLHRLGAARILGRTDFRPGSRPLEHAEWGGAVDNVGGEILAGITRTVCPGGNIAAIGLAAGHELHTTVMPFIIRGVSLLGIDSASCPMDLRRQVWQRLATDLRPPHLADVIAGSVTLAELPAAFERVMAGGVRGRLLVRFTDDY